MTYFLARSWVKFLDTVDFGIPRSASSSHTVSRYLCWLQFYTFNILRCSACCRPSRMWITFNRSSTIFELFVPHFYLYWTHCIIPESLLNHLKSFRGGIFKLNAKFDADSSQYLLSHFECDGHSYTCSLSSVYCLPWLVQWSHHCSCMHIPIYPPWLPCYSDVAQTIHITLIIAGLFPDRPRLNTHTVSGKLPEIDPLLPSFLFKLSGDIPCKYSTYL